ncbi:putative aromatic-L-amino-acid decarboxylase, partial [Apostichopus japonicus]
FEIIIFNKEEQEEENMATSKEFRVVGKDMVDYICDYVDTIEQRPPLAQVEPGYLQKLIPHEAPQKAESWEEIKKDIERVIMPGVTHWHSPHFHAYFPTGNSFPSILGDMLSDAISCIGFSWIASPACTELETVVMDWLGKMIKLPESFLAGEKGLGGGVIQGSASESTVVALLAAKMRVIRRHQETNPNLDQFDILPKLVAYTSDQSHSSVERASLIASVRMRQLATDDKHSLRGDTLLEAMKQDRARGLIPTFVSHTPLHSPLPFHCCRLTAPSCKDEDIWLHVDAAYAGSAFICPEYRSLLNGVEFASSFNFNPHKFMRVNFDLSAMWVKDKRDIVGAFHVDPVYLQHEHQGLVEDYRHWQIPLGRRFRSLKLWFVLRMFGVEKLQEHIRHQVKLAREFKALVMSDSRFTVEAEVILGLVCFRLKGTNQRNKDLLDRINKTGKIHMIGTQLKGRYILRFAVCAATTESRHVMYAWQVIKHCANDLLSDVDEFKEASLTNGENGTAEACISPD